MTGTELDDILASEQPQETTPEQAEQTTEGPARDEHGRFAAKAEEAAVEEAQQPEVEADAEHSEGKIPPSAIAAARQKAREKENENEQLRRELAELRGRVEVLSARPQPEPKVQAEPEQPKSFWDDPDNFVKSALAPVQQQMQSQRENFSMMLAAKEHGEEVVGSAYQAIVEALQRQDPAAAAEYNTIMANPHPYGALVAWHSRQKTLQTVGSDPNAWLEAEIEKRLADPAHQAKILERLQSAAAQNTDRSHAPTKLPPSLSRLPAGSHSSGSMNDESLFSQAMR